MDVKTRLRIARLFNLGIAYSDRGDREYVLAGMLPSRAGAWRIYFHPDCNSRTERKK